MSDIQMISFSWINPLGVVTNTLQIFSYSMKKLRALTIIRIYTAKYLKIEHFLNMIISYFYQ